MRERKDPAREKRRLAAYLKAQIAAAPAPLEVFEPQTLALNVWLLCGGETEPYLAIESGAAYNNGLPVVCTEWDNFMEPKYFWCAVSSEKFVAWISECIASVRSE